MRKILSLFFVMALCVVGVSAQGLVQGQPHPSAPVTSTKPKSQLRADTSFSFDDIQFWVGSGSKKAALVIEWHDEASPDALVWGYRWDGEASGHDMIVAISKADPRLVLLTQYTGRMGYTIAGIGYGESKLDISYDLEGAKNEPRNAFKFEPPITNPLLGQTSFPEHPAEDAAAAIREGVRTGVIYHPIDAEKYGYPSYDYDHWHCDNGIHWGAGWYYGYWSYFVRGSQTSEFSYSGLGATSRMLTDGCWDAWSWNGDMSTMEGTQPGDTFVAAMVPSVEPEINFDSATSELSFSKVEGATSYEIRIYKYENDSYKKIATYVTDKEGNILNELIVKSADVASDKIHVPLKKLEEGEMYAIEVQALDGLEVIDTFRIERISIPVGNGQLSSATSQVYYQDGVLRFEQLSGYHFYLSTVSGKILRDFTVQSPSEYHTLSLPAGIYLLIGEKDGGRKSFKMHITQ